MKLNNIEAERARNSMSQNALCERLGISQKTYWNWINGKTSIPSAQIINMCELFRTTSDYLLQLEKK